MTKKTKANIKEQLALAVKLSQYEKDRLTTGELSELISRKEALRQAWSEYKKSQGDKESANLKESYIRLRKLNEKLSNRFGIFNNFIHIQVEEFLLALFVIFSFKAFFFQPFRIPTASMQPTLYGIHAEPLEKSEFPNIAVRFAQKLTHGRAYFNHVAETDCSVISVRQYMKFKFLIRTEIKLSNGKKITLPISSSVLDRDLDFDPLLPIKAGGTILCGSVDTGDMIIVNKMSYHFRQPKRGEVVVFDTLGMTRLKESNAGPVDQQGGLNYIKRLVGVPGDTISIESGGKLMINGEEAQEYGMQKVMQAEGLYVTNQGYQVAVINPHSTYKNYYLEILGKQQTLFKSDINSDKQEYVAMGDNTVLSSDSRYWGAVPQHNLVGAAGFVLWPFKTENWGFIK